MFKEINTPDSSEVDKVQIGGHCQDMRHIRAAGFTLLGLQRSSSLFDNSAVNLKVDFDRISTVPTRTFLYFCDGEFVVREFLECAEDFQSEGRAAIQKLIGSSVSSMPQMGFVDCQLRSQAGEGPGFEASPSCQYHFQSIPAVY